MSSIKEQRLPLHSISAANPGTPMNRRQFLTTTAASAAALALAGTLRGAEGKKPNPFELVPLGKTGIKTSRICLGTGMRGGNRRSNQTRLGQDGFNALVKGAWERGVRVFDSADLYGSMPYLADALKEYPRDQYVIFTKIWARTGGIPEPERPDADVVIDRFRKELKSDYIDLVLLHCMESGTWTDDYKKQMDIMAGLKSKGIIKAHGASVHSLPAMKLCVDSPWVDSVHVRVNHRGASMDNRDPQAVVPVIKQLHDAGKGVVGMKLIGEGRFTNEADRVQSIEFVHGLGTVDIMNVGFEKVDQIDEFAKHLKETMSKKASG
jgi:aryl-alcohol dehydrogenase-like predicted oxidoreductase